MEEQEDLDLDKPSDEDLELEQELLFAQKKYNRRLNIVNQILIPTKGQPKGGLNGFTKSRLENALGAIEQLLLGFKKLGRFNASQRYFAIKLLKNAAMLEFKEAEKQYDDHIKKNKEVNLKDIYRENKEKE